MSGFQHDIAGGAGNLVVTSVQSPNYATGSAGWQIRKDGSAEFNNLTIRGTFNGTDFILNAAGFFLYSGTPANGNLAASIAAVSGTDAFGNAYIAGVASYSGAVIVQLNAGGIGMQAAAGQIAGGYEGVISAGAAAGQTLITSGGNSAGDPQAEVALASAAVAGTPTVTITNNLTVNGTLTINGSTSTGTGSNGGVTSGPSGTVNAFPAAGPNHTHAEAHTHPL